MSQEPSGLCWWLFSPAEFLAPGEHLLCSHMTELAAWVGLCGAGLERLQLTLLGAWHPFPQEEPQHMGGSVKPWKDPGLALRQTWFQSSFCWELAV